MKYYIDRYSELDIWYNKSRTYMGGVTIQDHHRSIKWYSQDNKGQYTTRGDSALTLALYTSFAYLITKLLT